MVEMVGERERDWTAWAQIRVLSEVWRSWKKRKGRGKEKSRRVSGGHVDDIAGTQRKERRAIVESSTAGET